MSRLFPRPPARPGLVQHVSYGSLRRKPIPTSDEFLLIFKNIKSALAKEGYHNWFDTVIQGYVVNPNMELPYEFWDPYWDHNISMLLGSEGDKVSRFNMMLVNIIGWAYLWSSPENKGNLLVLSSNKNFGQGTKFPIICEALEERGMNVAIAHPDTFKSGSSTDRSLTIFCFQNEYKTILESKSYGSYNL